MPQGSHSLRTIFFGMNGSTSASVLSALLHADIEICGVVVAAGRFARATRPEPIVRLEPPVIPMAGSATIVEIAHARGIPALELRRSDAPETLRLLADLRPAVACVACFPLRIPPALLALPRHGFLNMHPSLLPRHRGPEPLFWTFRAGERTAGATIHFMDAHFDTGDIVAQAPVELPDGIGGPAAEQACATRGAELMIESLRAIGDGTLTRQSQPPGGSYESSPRPDDWRLSTGWSTRRAYNFMRGTAEWGQAYKVTIGADELRLAEALAYQADAALSTPYIVEGDEVQVQFTPGVLKARLG